MKNKVLIIAFFMMVLTSCFVQSPKYSTLDKVMTLQLGMTKAQVEDTLGILPYDLKTYTDSSSVFIYVYRVVDRKTLSILTKPLNGKKSLGKYVQLEVAYSKDWKVISIESCNLCPDNLATTKEINFGKGMMFFAVTLPVLLVFFGLKSL